MEQPEGTWVDISYGSINFCDITEQSKPAAYSSIDVADNNMSATGVHILPTAALTDKKYYSSIAVAGKNIFISGWNIYDWPEYYAG